MSATRSLTSIAIASAMVIGQLTALSAGALAQGWPSRHKEGSAVHRTAPPSVARVITPHVPVSPPVRYVAPAPRPHFGGGDYRRHHGGGHSGGGDRIAAGIALGVGALIVGSAIASSGARASSRNADYERCAARFEDFDWNDGTFLNRDGERVVCPYLE
jgi:BA14K-like protein